MLPAIQPGQLRRVPVALRGAWAPGIVRDWSGLATADEPIVGVAFCCSGTRVEWCKSERPTPEGLDVRILLGHYDPSGLDVQVGFSMGKAGVQSRTTMHSVSEVPPVGPHSTTETGIPQYLTSVGTYPRIDLWALFITRAEVVMGRNGLWHLRRELAGSIPEPYRSIFSHGRTGLFNTDL